MYLTYKASWGGVKGLGHLWYMTAIAICYLITPFLQWSQRYGKIKYVFIFVFVFMDAYLFSFNYYYIWLYALSYFTARTRHRLLGVSLFVVMCVLMLHSLTWRDFIDFTRLGVFFKCILGLLLLNVCLVMAHYLEVKDYRIITYLSKYSYNLYIVHHLPIMMPFSLLALHMNIVPKMVILFIVIYTSSVLLCYTSDYFEKSVKKNIL